MVEDKFIMMIILQYLADTQYKRVHQKDYMDQNAAAYYRALENMINESKHN